MPKKTKLKLEGLKIKSFITGLGDDARHIRGGDDSSQVACHIACGDTTGTSDPCSDPCITPLCSVTCPYTCYPQYCPTEPGQIFCTA